VFPDCFKAIQVSLLAIGIEFAEPHASITRIEVRVLKDHGLNILEVPRAACNNFMYDQVLELREAHGSLTDGDPARPRDGLLLIGRERKDQIHSDT